MKMNAQRWVGLILLLIAVGLAAFALIAPLVYRARVLASTKAIDKQYSYDSIRWSPWDWFWINTCGSGCWSYSNTIDLAAYDNVTRRIDTPRENTNYQLSFQATISSTGQIVSASHSKTFNGPADASALWTYYNDSQSWNVETCRGSSYVTFTSTTPLDVTVELTLTRLYSSTKTCDDTEYIDGFNWWVILAFVLIPVSLCFLCAAGCMFYSGPKSSQGLKMREKWKKKRTRRLKRKRRKMRARSK